MKRCMAIAVLLLMMTCGCAWAEVLTDAPGTPTQDIVLSLESFFMDEARTPYGVQVMQADQLTMDTVTDIFEFVYKQKNRAARYFPEETQQAIAEMYGIDPDILYMTEFMRLHKAEVKPHADVKSVMTVDVDYYPGQLIVVVLGDTSNPEDIEWTPVMSRVTDMGVIEYDVPQELIEQMQGEDVLFSLLTVRPGGRGEGAFFEEETDPRNVPSKTATDSTYVVSATDASGKPLDRWFRLLVVSESEVIRKELAKIRKHIVEDQLPASTHLPQNSQNEFELLIGKLCNVQEMPIYEYVSLITENYRDTDGDCAAVLAFATPYKVGQTVITALGLPKEGAQDSDPTLMNWAVQRAEVMENGTLEIIFDQLALIGMGEEKGLLLVFSEPFIE